MLAALQRIEIAAPDSGERRAILRSAARVGRRGRRDCITGEAIEAIDRLHRRFATYSALPGRVLRFLENLLADQAGEVVTGKDVVAAFAAETGCRGSCSTATSRGGSTRRASSSRTG